MNSSELIDDLLKDIYEEFKSIKGSGYLSAKDRKHYEAHLRKLYHAAIPRRASNTEIKKLIKNIRRIERNPKLGTHKRFIERHNARDILFSRIFPYRTTPHVFFLWLVKKALIPASTTFKMEKINWPKFVGDWSEDAKMALIESIAASLQSIFLDLQKKEQEKWDLLEEDEKLKIYKRNNIHDKYEKYLTLNASASSLHSEYVFFNEEYCSRSYVINFLDSEAVINSEYLSLTHDYLDYKIDYEYLKERLYRKYKSVFSAVETKQKQAKEKLSRYVAASKEAENCNFEIPSGTKDYTIKTLLDLITEKKACKVSAYKFLKADNIIWQQLLKIDDRWCLDFLEIILKTINLEKHLRLDLLLRYGAAVSGIIQGISLNIHPITEIETALIKGDFGYLGVYGDGDVSAAIDRAIQAEEEIIRFNLENCGPHGLWTQKYAHLHDKNFNRRESSKERDKLFSELDERLKCLAEADP